MRPEERIEDFLDEDFLRKLESLKMLAKRGFKGPLRGVHIARRTGASLEFLDYRTYQAGDDFRYIDWNVYGRLDKLFLKLFREEEDLTIHILLDMSGSMDFGTPRKAIYAKKIAASLGYIGLAHLDRVGITAFSETLGSSLTPVRGKNQYLHLLRYLLPLQPEGRTSFNSCCESYASTCKRPGVAIVISDLMDPRGFTEGLDALRYRKFDISLIQVLNQHEMNPIADGYLTLKEVETGQTRRMNLDNDLLDLYRMRMRRYLDEISEFCHHHGIDYFIPDTGVPFEDFVFDYLRQGAIFQ
jgi:uncharacterized protein (DUF58 family)